MCADIMTPKVYYKTARGMDMAISESAQEAKA